MGTGDIFSENEKGCKMATASVRQFLEAKCSSVLVTTLSTAFSILLTWISVEMGVSIFLSCAIVMPMTLECHNPTEQLGLKGKHKEITERIKISVNPLFTFYCKLSLFFKFMKWLGLHSVSLGEDQP